MHDDFESFTKADSASKKNHTRIKTGIYISAA